MGTNSWGRWIQSELDRRGWTQKDAADATGVHHSSFSDWIKSPGGRQPSVEMVRKVAQGFGVPVLKALIIAGHITEEEAQGLDLSQTPRASALTTKELFDELRSRILHLEAAQAARGSDARVKFRVARSLPEEAHDEPEERRVGRKRSDESSAPPASG